MYLIKGVLDYEGLGSDKRWVIITRKGEHKNIWPEFCEEIYRLEFLKIQIGKDHINIKGHNKWDNLGNPLNRDHLKKSLSGREFRDSYIDKMLFYLHITLESLKGKHVRIRSFGGSFFIMSTHFFEYLKSIGEENQTGRYRDDYGFCYINSNRRKDLCRFGEKNQCIFAISFFKKGLCGNYIESCLCGKYSKNFADEQLRLFRNGKLGSMKNGNCGPPRGYEF